MWSALALTLVTTAAAPGETLLEICRSAYESFEPKAAAKSCSAAADVAELTVTQRIQALRYLAQSHILANEDTEASRAFTRMLVLDDTLLLTRDAGPRERDVFARARANLDQRGRITATHVIDDLGRVRVDVRDPLARVAGARVRVRADDRISVGTLAGMRTGDSFVLGGALPALAGVAEVRYEILLDGHTGAQLAVDAPLQGTRRIPGAGPGALASADARPKPYDSIGYSLIAAGIGLEAAWMFAVTPVLAITLEPETGVPLAIAGMAAFGGVIATGTGLVFLGPEATESGTESPEVPR